MRKTRALIIHDLDAMPLSPNIFEDIYDHWLHERVPFCGIEAYRGNGVDEQMGLVRTFELALDAGHLRNTFEPTDLFNKLRLVDGRLVDFDTMLDAQRRSGRCRGTKHRRDRFRASDAVDLPLHKFDVGAD